nr:DUF6049 family protein [Nocardioides thalensis]
MARHYPRGVVRRCRPALVRGAVVAALAGGGLTTASVVAPGPARAAAEEAPYEPALTLTIDELAPGYVPESGPIEITGTVTNTDVVAWEDVTVYPFFDCSADPACGAGFDQKPMTTAAELAEAAQADPEEVVGNRILTEGVEDEVGDIDPGESASYSLTVPRSELAPFLTGPGVYWFGVHALGSSEATPYDSNSDGRARTFLPYIGPRMAEDRTVDAAVVIPLRRRITHLPNGAVGRRGLWDQALSADGNLGRLLAFGSASVDDPVSWLVDPAVPDAVRQLARGNKGRSIAPTGPAPGEDGQEEGEGVDPEATDTAVGEDAGEEESAEPANPEAQAWLDDLEDELGTGLSNGQVLALPYGDLDVAGAAESDPRLYRRAREQTSILDDWGIITTPVLGSPGGYLDANGFLLADDSSAVLLTDRMFGPEAFPDGPPRVGKVGQHRVVVTSYAASTGGPGPDPRLTGLQLRQRMLSEAAVRLLSPDPAPLVVVLPGSVDPADAGDFWSGLDPRWLDVGTVGQVAAGATEEIGLDDLDYPEDQEDYELPDYLFDQARGLADAGDTLQRMLSRNDTVGDQVRTEALTGASYSARPDPSGTASMLSASEDWIRRVQARVRISAPPGVTLSSADGSFAVTVRNQLKQPVTVRISADTEDGIAIESGDPVELAPNSRTTVVLDAHTDALGVHNVRLAVTDIEGNSLGATAVVPVRSGQVGEIIWWFIGGGCGILFVAIAIRLVRRIRGTGGSEDEPDGGTAGEDATAPEPAGAAPTEAPTSGA